MASELLKGEGDTTVLVRTKVRHECEVCGEPATQRHSFMMPNYRSNPASSGYRKDDCSWCSDHDAYTCDEHKARDLTDVPEGYSWGGTWGKAFPHMLLCTTERELPALLIGAKDMEGALTGIQDLLAEWIVPDSGISDHEVLNRILSITDHRDVLTKQQAVRMAIIKASSEADAA